MSRPLLVPMQLVDQVSEMRALAERKRCQNLRIALVPTMGALHEGHLTLIRRAREVADWVVTSVFVNPTQFAPDEDLERYPRDIEGDADTLEAMGVDALFAPPVEEMYPHGEQQNLTWVMVEKLDQHLCGAYRPGHFRGVTTVVSKLFNVIRPHVAVFGRKDAQQLVIIRRLVEELLLDVDVQDVPIVREEDGLAKSSRNAYLTPEQRRQSVVLFKAVSDAKRRIEHGEQGVEGIVEAMREILTQASEARVQYAEVVDQSSLAPVRRLQPGQKVIAAVAVYFGDTRLIDNAFATVANSA